MLLPRRDALLNRTEIRYLSPTRVSKDLREFWKIRANRSVDVKDKQDEEYYSIEATG